MAENAVVDVKESGEAIALCVSLHFFSGRMCHYGWELLRRHDSQSEGQDQPRDSVVQAVVLQTRGDVLGKGEINTISR